MSDAADPDAPLTGAPEFAGKANDEVGTASAFNPLDIEGLTVWLDAADYTPGAWPNRAGADPILVGTPDPAISPELLNGLPVVRFKASEGRLRGERAMGADLGYYKFTIIYVVRLWGPNVGRAFTSVYPGSGNFLVGFHTTAQDAVYDNGWMGGAAWTAAPGAWKLYSSTAHHTGTVYSHRFFKDGALIGELTNGAGIGPRYALSGYDETGTPETMDCEVAELLVWERQIADADRISVEDYLRAKWGLA